MTVSIAAAQNKYEYRYRQRPAGRAAGIAVAFALHAIAIVLMLQYEPARRALLDVAPIMVNLIAPVAEQPQDLPKPLPVKRKVRQPPVDLPPVLTAAATEAPAPYVAPPPVLAAAAPESAPAPAAVATPAPITPPNFNADYLRNPAPAYPLTARRLGQQGKVILRVLVGEAGLPSQVEIRAASGVGALDEAALDAVRRWRFIPARQGTQAISAWVLVPIVFTLER